MGSLRVVAIGTGANHTYIASPKNPDWGLIQWGPNLVDIFIDGAMGVVDYQCQKILGESQYRRLAPVLPGNKPIRMDDVSAVGRLLQHAEVIGRTDSFTDLAEWVRQRFR